MLVHLPDDIAAKTPVYMYEGKPVTIFDTFDILSEGVYEVGGFFSMMTSNMFNESHIFTSWQKEYWDAAHEAYDSDTMDTPEFKALQEEYHRKEDLGIYPPDYGVCDSPEQLLEKFPLIVTSDKQIIVTVEEVRKDEQPDEGGWRWHKWGPYVGEFEPQSEYLADEPNIDRVFIFKLYEINEK